MLTALRLCYFKSLSARDSVASGIKDTLSQAYQSAAESRKTWEESPSIFDKSPLDAIAHQRRFELERSYLKEIGSICPPLRPAQSPPGYVRVEYYSRSEIDGEIWGGKWDAWDDIQFTPRGGIDLAQIQKAFGLDLNHLVVVSPTRWRPFPIDRTRALTHLELRNLTYDGRVPLKVMEQDLPALTVTKRQIRALTITILCMLKAIWNLLHLEAYEEYEFSVRLPNWFLGFYDIARSFHPATQRYPDTPEFDVSSYSYVQPPLCATPTTRKEQRERERVAHLFQGPTRTQTQYASIIFAFLVIWFFFAEIISLLRPT
ncbi:hypothetical protein DFP72DRAFT_901965 [Ephemerocybe angulata]|uniref:Uncharacterized protein n=1 Tax=Ephemerocybe angulata TaxID=980116 RepID=A0A8H6HWE3_9AGAR|nr:hypothetical protein DFP72DRAFT_901965 [Tulosesus angulatus]